MTDARRFLRENLFLIAAVLLPLLVVGVFLLATAIPRWRVAPPAHDLLLKASGPRFSQARPVAVDFAVRNGRLEATIRALPGDYSSSLPSLYLFDHRTLNVREIPFDVPANLRPSDPPVTTSVTALADRRIVADARAPDGYEFRTDSRNGPGLFGELFGMGYRGERASVVKDGRVVRIPLGHEQAVYGVSFVGWVLHEESR